MATYEENAQDDTRSNERALKAAASLAATKPVSELDRLADQLAKQHELLNLLEEKLNPVSHRQPQESTDEETERFHISALVGYVIRNNRQLDKLINEIVL